MYIEILLLLLIQQAASIPAIITTDSIMKQQVDDSTVLFLRQQARLAKLADCLENGNDEEFTLIQKEEEITILTILKDRKRTHGVAGYIGISSSDAASHNNTKSTMTVGFSSTRGVKDWAKNLNLLNRRPYIDLEVEFCDGFNSNWSMIPSDARIHKGFYSAFIGVVGQIMDVFEQHNLIKDCQDVSNEQLTVDTVRFIGRSLGGAVASISSIYFATLLRTSIPIELVTFGSPRFANPQFATWMGFNSNVTSFRVVNPYDLVARVPPGSKVYRHIPVEYFVDDGNDKLSYSKEVTYKCLSVIQDDELLESPECSNAVSWFKLGVDSHNYYHVEDCPFYDSQTGKCIRGPMS